MKTFNPERNQSQNSKENVSEHLELSVENVVESFDLKDDLKEVHVMPNGFVVAQLEDGFKVYKKDENGSLKIILDENMIAGAGLRTILPYRDNSILTFDSLGYLKIYNIETGDSVFQDSFEYGRGSRDVVMLRDGEILLKNEHGGSIIRVLDENTYEEVEPSVIKNSYFVPIDFCQARTNGGYGYISTTSSMSSSLSLGKKSLISGQFSEQKNMHLIDISDIRSFYELPHGSILLDATDELVLCDEEGDTVSRFDLHVDDNLPIQFLDNGLCIAISAEGDVETVRVDENGTFTDQGSIFNLEFDFENGESVNSVKVFDNSYILIGTNKGKVKVLDLENLMENSKDVKSYAENEYYKELENVGKRNFKQLKNVLKAGLDNGLISEAEVAEYLEALLEEIKKSL